MMSEEEFCIRYMNADECTVRLIGLLFEISDEIKAEKNEKRKQKLIRAVDLANDYIQSATREPEQRRLVLTKAYETLDAAKGV